MPYLKTAHQYIDTLLYYFSILLFLIVNHFQYGLTDCFQRILINMFHIVIDSMPCRGKITFLIVGNDIDRFNTCQTIYEQMVVCYKSSVSIHESLSVTRFFAAFQTFLFMSGANSSEYPSFINTLPSPPTISSRIPKRALYPCT